MNATAPNTASSGPLKAVLALCLLVGAALRYVSLDAPPLRWDELVVPLTARHPLEYILAWCQRCEVHPPGFHLLIKALLEGGSFDYVLRLPALAAGLALIWITWKALAELFSRQAALVGAALVATDPYLVLFSRQVRPYTLWLCLLGLSLLFFHRAMRSGGRNWLWLLGVNALAYGTHFLSVIVLPAQVLCALYMERSLRSPKVWRSFLCVLGPFLLISPFLWGMVQREAVAGGQSYTQVVQATATLLAGGFFPFHWGWPAQVLAAAAALFAVVRLFARAPMTAAYMASMAAFPVLAVVALRYGSYYNPWHFIFLPYLAMLALATLFARASAPVALLGAAALAALNLATWSTPQVRLFYSPDYVYEGRFIQEKTTLNALAQRLPLATAGADAVHASIESLYHGLDWYTRQYCPQQDITRNAVTPEQKSVRIVTASDTARDDLGQPLGDFAPYALYAKTVERSPLHRLEPGKALTLDSSVDHFYRDVLEARDVTVLSERGQTVHPAHNGPGPFFSYRFDGEGLSAPLALAVRPQFSNGNQGALLAVSARFDDEAERPLMNNVGKAGVMKQDYTLLEPTLYLRRLKPFRSLVLTFRMDSPLKTPSYPGGNLSMLRFMSVRVTPMPYGTDFFAPDSLDREITWTGMKDVEREDTRAWRWATGPETRILVPADEAGPRSLHFALSNVMQGQNVTVFVNGREAASFGPLPTDKWLESPTRGDISFDALAGNNEIVFRYLRWNSPDNPVLSDPSPYSVVFTELSLK